MGIKAWLRLYQGGFDEGVGLWAEVYDSATRRGDQQSRAVALSGQVEHLLSLADLSPGDDAQLDACARTLAEARRFIPTDLDRLFDIHHLGLLAGVALRRGRPEEARPALRRVTALVSQPQQLASYAMAVYARAAKAWIELWRHDGLSDADQRLARGTCRALGRYGRTFPVGRARALHTLGELCALQGRVDAARRKWEEGLRVARRLSLTYDATLLRASLAREDR